MTDTALDSLLPPLLQDSDGVAGQEPHVSDGVAEHSLADVRDGGVEQDRHAQHKHIDLCCG